MLRCLCQKHLRLGAQASSLRFEGAAGAAVDARKRRQAACAPMLRCFGRPAVQQARPSGSAGCQPALYLTRWHALGRGVLPVQLLVGVHEGVDGVGGAGGFGEKSCWALYLATESRLIPQRLAISR